MTVKKFKKVDYKEIRGKLIIEEQGGYEWLYSLKDIEWVGEPPTKLYLCAEPEESYIADIDLIVVGKHYCRETGKKLSANKHLKSEPINRIYFNWLMKQQGFNNSKKKL